MDNSNFSVNLRELRNKKSITQAQLAESLNVSQKTIAHLENNYRKPSYELLLFIADFFKISLDELVGRQCQQNIKECISVISAQELHSAIIEILKAKNLTAKQMLSDIGLNHCLITDMKNGSMIGADKLCLIGKYLNTSTDFLLGISNDPNIHQLS